MSFEEIWQENKAFILTILGGLVFFVTGYFLITGAFEKDIRSNLAAKARSDRNAKRARLPGGKTTEIDQRLESLEETLATVERELGYRPREGFTLSGISKAPDIHFNEVIQKMLTDVVEPASSLDIRLAADLGLGTVTPRTNAEYEWYLNGLDIVNRACEAGIAAGVESIEPIKIARMPKKKKSERRDPVTPYLRRVGANFIVRGSPASVDRFLRALMLEGRRLSVAKASLSSLDQAKKKRKKVVFTGEALVSLDITVNALILDGQGQPTVLKTARF